MTGYCKIYSAIIALGIIINLKVDVTCLTTYYIKINNYPVEEHTVNTADGYILTIYRIPYSPKSPHTLEETLIKPVILLQHGFVLTSDAWVMLDANEGLPYLLADAGYDVWLGNQRGNTYSRQHKHIHPSSADFWNFSFHEVGYYDLAAMVDYILADTSAFSLHYIGYSMGTSTALVLLSTRPEYAPLVKSMHLLAPVAYMQRMQQPFTKFAGFVLSFGTLLAKLFGYREVLWFGRTSFHRRMCSIVCAKNSMLNCVCKFLYGFIAGPGTQHMNESLLANICEIQPAGGSSKQILHFVQIYDSGDFRQYDYGQTLNMQHYQQATPPLYNIEHIANCINLYYSDNDYMVAAVDVEDLAKVLPCAELHRIPHPDWNHYDFLWSKNVKNVLNEHIIAQIKLIEDGYN